jgi:thiamine biosynthesis lipoprotein
MKLLSSLSLSLSLALAACPKKQSEPQPTPSQDAGGSAQRPASPPSAPASARAEPTRPARLVAAGREIMSTWWEIKVETREDEAPVRGVLEQALDEIARLEGVLSEWREGTELSQINAAAGSGNAIEVSPDTFEVLRVGMDVSELSGGAFDLSWAAMRGVYRFDGEEHGLPDAKLVAEKRKLISYKQIAFDPEAHTVALKKKGMAIGAGGIAKGYALDRAAAMLERAGYANYLLFAGGQVQVHGAREGRAWRVGIKHPRHLDRHVGAFELHNGSIATSGDYEHSYMVGDKRVHHIIDPKTGQPVEKTASVTLIAGAGVYADALSTACFVMGPKPCIAFLERVPGQPDAVIIDPEMRVFMTPGRTDKVFFDPPLEDGRLPE